ncbi:MAG: hypothetical protein EA403_04535 [Spirochaetaceae bacterium]|nr:MAG: hypothetical protein EA403_04535 [Spirochaetaceae bacterium]
MVKSMRLRRIAVIAWLAMTLVSATACSLIFSPDQSVGSGRTRPRTVPELFVVHSLAETLTAVGLSSLGVIDSVDADVALVGSIPNHLLAVGNQLVVTSSGENRLVVLDIDTLQRVAVIDLGSGRNPYTSTALSDNESDPAFGLVATTNWLTDTVSVSNLATRRVIHRDHAGSHQRAEFSVGPRPQAVVALPGDNPGHMRIVTANTNFSAGSFGVATLTELTVSIEESGNVTEPVSVELEAARSVPLSHNGQGAEGLNPTALIVLPDAGPHGTLVVVGSGTNTGGGTDDGVVLFLNAGTLVVEQRLTVGGSPGSGAAFVSAFDSFVVLAGIEGLRAVRFDAGTNQWVGGDLLIAAAPGGSGLSFFSDIAVVEEYAYVSDFQNNRLLGYQLAVDAEDGLSLNPVSSTSLSQGPIALRVVR